MARDNGIRFSVTLSEFLSTLHVGRARRIRIQDAEEFAIKRSHVDVVFAINTFDVVPPATRAHMTEAAIQNLRREGLYVVIIPRNDVTITSRCTRGNRFLDGHVFTHHGVRTFFRNFQEYDSVIRLIRRRGAELIADLSVYRHVCLLFAKRA